MDDLPRYYWIDPVTISLNSNDPSMIFEGFPYFYHETKSP